MKLWDTIILATCIAFFVIGVHQTITVGFGAAYWIFMFSISLLLLYRYRRQKRADNKDSR